MAFDTGVGFAFTGKDAGLSKAAGSASSAIGGIGSAIDGVGERLRANAENVQAFLKEFSQAQLDRINDGLQSIADSASVNQTSLEGMAVSASKAAKPIVTSLGLTGQAAKKAKGQIVGLSIGMNVGAEAVGNAVKAMQLYGEELQAVGIDSVKTATKFQEVAGVQIDKFGSQVADLRRSWGLTQDQLADLVPWILESGKAFGFGREAVEGLANVTQSLDQNLSKVLLKNGPEAIMQFTRGIQGLALVASEALGMEFPDALGQSIDLFNKLSGDMASFQKTFAGMSTEFGPMAQQLGLAIGDWDTAFQLVQQDPLEFAKQLRVLIQNMDQADSTSQAFLSRLKLQLGEDSTMLRFLTEQSERMDESLGKLEGVQAGTESLKKFADRGFSTGRTMAEQLDLMRDRAKLGFMSISRELWRPYMKNLREGYGATVDMMKNLASNTEPGGIGYLVKIASMGMRFGPGGVIAAMFPGEAGREARGILDALSDSLVDMLPHLTALGALGFRPSMLAAPFKSAFKPLSLLLGPLGAFNNLLRGIPKLALSIFGPLGVLSLAIGGFVLFSKKWKGEQESEIETFFKTDLPIAIMRGIKKLTLGEEWTKAMDKKFRRGFQDMSSSEIWGEASGIILDALGQALEVGMEAMEIGTDVLVDFTDRFADALTGAMEKIDWDKFGTALAKILTNLTKAAGAIVAKIPQIVRGLARGIVIGLSKIDWSGLFGGVKKDLGKEAEGVGQTMQAGFGWENVLGAGAIVGVPLLLRKFKKIKKDVKKGVPPEAAGLPKCIPMCGEPGMITTKGGRQIMAPTKARGGPAPPPLPPAAKGYPMGAISGPGAVMQPLPKGPGMWTKAGGMAKKAGGMAKAGYGKAMGWKGIRRMGAMGGVVPGLMMGGMAMAGEDVGLVEGGIGYGTALAMGGPRGLAVAALMTGAGGAVSSFREHWDDEMDKIAETGGDTADTVESAFAVSMTSITEGVDDMTLGLTKKIRDWAAGLSGINEVTGEQIVTVWKMVWNRVATTGEVIVATFMDGFSKLVEAGQVTMEVLVESTKAMWRGWSAYVKGMIKGFFSWGRSLIAKGKVFFLEMQHEVMEVVQNMVLSSLQLFSGIFRPMADVFENMKESTREWMQENLPGFKALDDMVTGLADEVDKKITKKSLEYMKENLDVQRKIVEGKAEGLRLERQANEEIQRGKVALASESQLVAGLAAKQREASMEFLKGMVSVMEAVPVGVISMFAPGILKKLGLETAAEWQKAGFEEWEALRKKLTELQEDAYEVTADEQAAMIENAAAQAETTLEEMGKDLGGMGVKKGRRGKVMGVAEKALEQMGKAETAEEAAEILAKAQAKGKTPAEQQAIGSMLTAAGASLFQFGAKPSKPWGQKRMIGAMKKEGLAYVEALTEAQLEGLSEAEKGANKKRRKNIRKQKAATEKVLETIGGAMTEAEAPAAPAAVDIGGGIQMLAPPPPVAPEMAGPGGSWVQAQAPGAGGAQNVTIVAQNVSMKGNVTGPLHSQYTGENQVVNMAVG